MFGFLCLFLLFWIGCGRIDSIVSKFGVERVIIEGNLRIVLMVVDFGVVVILLVEIEVFN